MLIIMLVCIHVCNILFMMGEKLFSEDEYSALLKYLPPLTARPGDGLSTDGNQELIESLFISSLGNVDDE